MLKQVLNIGVSATNEGNLNRKIRISNLISFITIITMSGYIPVAIGFQIIGIIVLNSLFLASAFLSFYLNAKKKYDLSFYIASSFGLIYFVFGTIVYGGASNLQFFILIMCLIAIALFKSNFILRLYISISIISFFMLVLFLPEGHSIIAFTGKMATIQKVISLLNLLLLFIITILFFVFFRRENLLFQKKIIEQKEMVEDKQKEIIDSINYAKRIQQSLLPTEKYIEKTFNRLNKKNNS